MDFDRWPGEELSKFAMSSTFYAAHLPPHPAFPSPKRSAFFVFPSPLRFLLPSLPHPHRFPFAFCFGIPRVLGNSFLGRLKESGLQARAGRCRGRAPKLKTKMRSESSASKKKVPSCDYRAPPPPKRNEKALENIAEAACKHISYKSVGHRTACLADIWKSYTDRRLENASGTKRLALSRETFFLRIIDFLT